MEELGTDLSACPCGHVYHSVCIRTWIKQKRLCPQCKCDALPLAPLKFNLFQVSQEEKQLSLAERMSAVSAEFTAIKLGIENEQAEMNVLEPELAQAKLDERAYAEGVKAREKRKLALEIELERKRFELHDIEQRRKGLAQELEEMRSKVLRIGIIDDGSLSSGGIRRSIHASELPKLISFLLADHKKLSEIEVERVELEEQSGLLKAKLGEMQKRLKTMGTQTSNPSVPSLSSARKFEGGFVPSDVFGSKRRLEEQVNKQLEKRKPSLNEFGHTKNKKDVSDSLETLSALVAMLSDDDNYDPFAETQFMDFSADTHPIDLTS